MLFFIFETKIMRCYTVWSSVRDGKGTRCIRVEGHDGPHWSRSNEMLGHSEFLYWQKKDPRCFHTNSAPKPYFKEGVNL